MKIVDVCAYFVHDPKSGGQARVFGFNQAMSKYASIEQFSFTPVLMRKKSFVYNKNYAEHIYNKILYTKAVVLLKLLGIKNYDFIVPFVFKFVRMPKKMRKALKNADVVQVEHPWLLSWVARSTEKPIILVAHNVEYDLQKEFFNKTVFRKNIVKSIEKIEQSAVNKADSVFAMSLEDKKRISELYQNKNLKSAVFVVPNGADTHAFSRKMTKETARKKLGLEKDKPIIIFVGAKHPPNDEAARFIEEKLAPKMHDTVFIIAGSVRDKKVTGNVVCTGSVPDLNPYYAAADLAINPVSAGSGSNLKMYSYLAAGLPVITTKKGNRGVNGRNNADLIITEINGFANKIKALLHNKNQMQTLSKNGCLLAKKFDWSNTVKKAIESYKHIRTKIYNKAYKC